VVGVDPSDEDSEDSEDSEDFDEFADLTEFESRHEPARAEPRPVDKWRRNTATGALTAALALGMQQVFDPEKRDTIGIEQEAPAKPLDPDEKVELRFDPLNSHGNVVVVHAPKPDEHPPPDRSGV
jgi:hypothetical protein